MSNTNVSAGQEPRKKVLFVVTKSNFGGSQRYVFDLATNLPKDRFETVVAFGGTGEADTSPGRLSSVLKKAGVRTIFIPQLGRDISLSSDRASFRALRHIIRAEKPEILHLNSSKVGGLGTLTGRFYGVPRIIFTAHGWPFWENRNVFPRAIIFFLSWLTILLSHRTICVSEYDRRHIRWMPFVKRKCVVIYNGIKSSSFLPREEMGTDVRVVTIAELTTNKNIPLAIDAVRRVNGIHYTIIGDGEAHLKIKEMAGAANVTLKHFIPDAWQYLTSYDIFLLTSKKEGLPYVILEAGAAGLPVIASRVGGIPEIITDKESGFLVAPSDIQGFADALGKLSADPELRTRMGTALQKTVAEKFSLTRMLENTTKLYTA